MSHAGLRRVMLSAEAMITSIGHIDAFTEPSPDRWVFTAGKGGPAREAALCAAWVEAATACGCLTRIFTNCAISEEHWPCRRRNHARGTRF